MSITKLLDPPTCVKYKAGLDPIPIGIVAAIPTFKWPELELKLFKWPELELELQLSKAAGIGTEGFQMTGIGIAQSELDPTLMYT